MLGEVLVEVEVVRAVLGDLLDTGLTFSLVALFLVFHRYESDVFLDMPYSQSLLLVRLFPVRRHGK